MSFSFVVCKSTGEPVGEALSASARVITRALNAPTTATLTLRLGDSLAGYMVPGTGRLKVYRSATVAEIAANPAATRQLLFYGSLPAEGLTMDAGADTVTGVYQDPRWVLARRYALGTETYAATDQGDILWGLVNTQNARSGGDTWIRQGSTKCSWRWSTNSHTRPSQLPLTAT